MTRDDYLRQWRPYTAALMRGAFYAVGFEIEQLVRIPARHYWNAIDWLKENSRGGWEHFHHDRTTNQHWFALESEEDAMMLKLHHGIEDMEIASGN